MDVAEAIDSAEGLLPGVAVEDGEDPRWQAIIRVGEFVESEPEAVWGFVRRWGAHEQEDVRMAVATCLLEHLLEWHFEGFFARVREACRENRFFADTFLMCWKFGQSELLVNSARFDKLQAECGDVE